MEESILLTIKKMLGLGNEYTPFDADIIVLINSAIMTLTQLHVGPKKGFSIYGVDQRWDEFLTNDVLLEGAKQYIFMKVKMAFDPPTNSFVMESLKQQCAELEWRLNVQAESVEDFDFVVYGTKEWEDKKKEYQDPLTTTLKFEVDESDEEGIVIRDPVADPENNIIHTAGTPPEKPAKPDPFEDPKSQEHGAGRAYEVVGENLNLFRDLGFITGMGGTPDGTTGG